MANLQPCRPIDPQWDYPRIIIEGPLDVFRLTYGHRLPSQYAVDLVACADAYIERFDSHPTAAVTQAAPLRQ